MADNEHTLASLGQSKILSVKHSVGEPIPAFDHTPEDGAKVPSFVRRQNTGNVLPYQPAGASALSKAKKLQRQVATVVIQSSSKSGDGERLAGRTAGKKVNCAGVLCSDLREVTKVSHFRIPASQHGAGECVNFCIRSEAPPQRFPRHCSGLDPRAHRKHPHQPPPLPLSLTRNWTSILPIGSTGYASFAPGRGRKFAIARKAAILAGDILPAFAAGRCSQFAILTEASFFIRYALPAFRCDRPLLFRVHGCEAAQ